MTDIERIEKLMTDQHKELSGQISVIDKKVDAIDVSIQGDESRGVEGQKHHIRRINDSILNHNERLLYLENQIPEEKRNGNRKMVAGAVAGSVVGGTAVKFGGWGFLKPVLTFFASLIK